MSVEGGGECGGGGGECGGGGGRGLVSVEELCNVNM